MQVTFVPLNQDPLTRAVAASYAGNQPHAWRIKESKSRAPAWDLYVRIGDSKRGKHIFSFINIIGVE